MCWPLTRRGGHTATTKEIERPPPAGGPAGAKRRNDREKEPPQRRRVGMIDAARWRKARAAAGCAQAPDLKPQAGPRSSPVRHDRSDPPDEARKFCAHRTRSLCLLVTTQDGQMVGFEAVLGLTRSSASRRSTTRQMVGDRSGRPNGLRGHWRTSCEWRREMVR
jgi:hypothetical protein